MRDPELIETDLMEIGAIPDDVVKLERIVAWCAAHPDEVPFALHQLMRHRESQEPSALAAGSSGSGQEGNAKIIE